MKTDLTDILHEITNARQFGNAIGLRLYNNEKIIITAVENILDSPGGDKIITVKPQCIYGDPLPNTTFLLSEIKGAVRFRIQYEDPFYTHLRNIKSNIRNIKRCIATIGKSGRNDTFQQHSLF